MSVLIKGMEMPCACVFCELYDGELYWCRGAKKEVPYSPEDKRAKFCPLVPIPPHGDLIDRREAIIDANERAYDFWNCDADVDNTVAFLKEQNTIIPASEEDE